MLLREKDKERLINIFESFDMPFEVWAYGSRVTGKAHDGSDLDLVIRSEGNKLLPLSTFSEMIDQIKESNIPILVELFDWNKLPASFHQNIEANYEVLFSNIQTMVSEPSITYKDRPKRG